jgi:formylglycine-generating enzyme required for sulfatase activity
VPTALLPWRNHGWHLTLQAASASFAARAGEPIVYPGRQLRAAKPWLELPISGISLADARAYLTWLRDAGRVPGARLCTEHEWERAARGADDREFPHGDDLAADEANFDETYGKMPRAFGPDAVGGYPASRSPFGVYDIIGNVAEWTQASLTGEGAALRGGSYYYGKLTGRATNRWTADPTARDVVAGVRVCADLRR